MALALIRMQLAMQRNSLNGWRLVWFIVGARTRGVWSLQHSFVSVGSADAPHLCPFCGTIATPR